MNQTVKKDSSREGVPKRRRNIFSVTVLLVVVIFLAYSCAQKREYLSDYCFPTRIVILDTTRKNLDLDNLLYLFSKYNADTIFSGNRTFTMNSRDFQFEIVEH